MQEGPASAYLQHINRSVIGVDQQGQIDFANPAAGSLFRIEPDDLVGDRLERWIIDCDELLAMATTSADSVMGQLEVFTEPAIRRGRRADGTELPLAIRAVRLGDGTSPPLALELEVRDGPLTGQDKRERLVEIVERTPNPVGIADPEGMVLYVNPGFRTFVGVDSHESLSARHIGEVHPPWATSKLQEEGLPAAQAAGIWEGETALWHVNGEELPVLQTIHAHYHSDGSVAFYSTIFRDVSELRDREAKLQGFYEILDNVAAYIFCKDEHLRYTYANSHVCELFGRPLEAIVGYADEEFFGEEGAQQIVDQADGVTLAEGRVTQQEERVYVVPKGEYRTFLSVKHPLWDDQGRVRGLYGVATDISEQTAREGKLAHQATHDPLTQVLNRSGAEAILERHRKLANRYGTPVCAILVDVDHFKVINDQLGHEVGDRVLVEVAATLSTHLREADVLTRWGGEEFLAVIPETERDRACDLAERLRNIVEQQMAQEAPAGTGTVSAGVAQYQPSESRRSWIRRADRALYEAKEAGRNCVRWSD